MKWMSDIERIKAHIAPAWFNDAKFGIFIHWGLYSVPAYAPTGKGNLNEILANEGQRAFFTHIPYAEWYINSMRIAGSPTQRYHEATYGKSFSYFDFAPRFINKSRSWDPDDWAELFHRAGAGYAVFVTKHMDGFLMWPSRTPNYRVPGYHARRDHVGELTASVRKRGMHMGLYYSSALDQSFTTMPMTDIAGLYTEGGPVCEKYIHYQFSHWKELIDRYRPDVLWGDISYPPGRHLRTLFTYYYDAVPDGVVNDRWVQYSRPLQWMVRHAPVRHLVNGYASHQIKKGRVGNPRPFHYDFITKEYEMPDTILAEKWESNRGIGNSFGYNRMEDERDYLSVSSVIELLVEVVSKNGNLLLNVGPLPDGTIPEAQRERLMGVGEWLAVNGEAIYGTSPWHADRSTTVDGGLVRFTRKGDTVFAVVFDDKPAKDVTIMSVAANSGTRISLLGGHEDLAWKGGRGDSVTVSIPNIKRSAHAYALRFSPGLRYCPKNEGSR
jgi:alpha-L-fucosidase